MGLPLFVAPIEPDAASVAVEKTPARLRSNIRRYRRTRTERGNSPSRRPTGRPPSTLPRNETQDSLESPGRELNVESDPQFGLPDAIIIPPIVGTEEWIRASRVSRSSRGGTPRMQSEAPPTTFFGSYTQSVNVPPVPPVPDSGDLRSRYASRMELRANLLRLHENRARRRLGREQPNSVLSESVSAAASNSNSPRLPALTPDFSPARRFVMNEGNSRTDVERELMNLDSAWAEDSMSTDSPPTLQRLTQRSTDRHLAEESSTAMPPDNSGDLPPLPPLPPLRRIGRRSLVDYLTPRHRVPRFDGLGDRDRSLSPDGDNAWDTLLTSIPPDPQAPSAGSSFASTSAAASASSNPVSSATSLTAMDSIADASFENACDILEDGNNDISDTDADDDEDIYELHNDSYAVRDRFWRSYADVVVARADRVARSVLPETDPLGGMQRIVRRLARREDIPDEWWAEVGLSRTFPNQSSN